MPSSRPTLTKRVWNPRGRSTARPIEGGVPLMSPSGANKFHQQHQARAVDTPTPKAMERSALPSAPCFLCGVRGFCRHRPEGSGL